MSDLIVNKVNESNLITIDLESFFPKEKPEIFDLKAYLFQGLVLKEKEFREALKKIKWNQYSGKTVLINCSADAIIPVWAYMLIAANLRSFAEKISLETLDQWRTKEILKNVDAIDIKEYSGKRIVIKGCGEEEIPEAAYFEITKVLQPVAKSIMYGEPCSTVPVYKQK